jgi:acyl-CoA reductase-like NAD-dependent aldehyde dehydrogenase
MRNEEKSGYPILKHPDQTIRPSTTSEIDCALTTLTANKDKWIEVPVRTRITLLDTLIEDFGALCEPWVALNLEKKGAVRDESATGIEWTGGPIAILRLLRGLRRALVGIEKQGRPEIPGEVNVRENGQVVARIYPQNLYERLTTLGITAEVWMEPGVSLDEVAKSQAVAYQGNERTGKVVGILGAGNVSGIQVNDSLSKLFVENSVVLLKMNPVNAYLGPLIERAFRALVEEGFLKIVYGGAAEGAYICKHPDVEEIHMTGSDKTYGTIVFGDGDEGVRRKEEHQPRMTKRITAELGNVGPAIIVPGSWSQEDLTYQAEQLVSHLTDNASYSCSRTRVILQHVDWPLREDLIQAFRSVAAKVPSRVAYYPGAVELYQRFLSAHPEAELIGSQEDGKLPWTLIPGIDPEDQDDICFKTESFCPVIAETALEAASPAEFLERAVEFANEHMWGTLSATIIVHPRSLEDPEVSSAFHRAVSDLRYGTVNINCIPGLTWVITTAPWGSYPGNKPWDIQSGTDFVHNPLMFSRPEKTVLRAPFRTWPRPIWFPSRVSAYNKVTRGIAMYEYKPSIWKVLQVLWNGILG